MSTVVTTTPVDRRSSDDGLSIRRLNVMRLGYAFIGVDSPSSSGRC